MVSAAVLTAIGAPLEVWDDIELEGPRQGEVTVQLAASGMCHTDMSMASGSLPPGSLPTILGHEGSGVIADIGPGVTDLAVGDPVVLSWLPQCGHCYPCLRGQRHLCEPGQRVSSSGKMWDGTTRASRGGQAIRQMTSLGTYAERAVVSAGSVVPLPGWMDLEVAALLGCGVLTGVGAVFHTAHVEPGDSVVVIGCGGVGLNVVQAAAVMGASTIIAVDRSPAKLAMAQGFGATHSVVAEGDVAEAVRALTGGRGADVCFEVVGIAETISLAVDASRRGGQVVLVGVPGGDVRLGVRALSGVVAAARTISGCWYGSANVHRDVPVILSLYRQGRLQLDELIGRRIGLTDVPGALMTPDDRGARTLVRYGPPRV